MLNLMQPFNMAHQNIGLSFLFWLLSGINWIINLIGVNLKKHSNMYFYLVHPNFYQFAKTQGNNLVCHQIRTRIIFWNKNVEKETGKQVVLL